jgi:hypothetical protein
VVVEEDCRWSRFIVTTRSGVLHVGPLPLPQVAASDLDIAVIGQLPPPKLALGDQFEPGSVKMILVPYTSPL